MSSFNINKPQRRSWNDWQKDLQALSGVRDVSKDDMIHKMEQTLLSKDPVRYADAYAAAECADGLARERNPREISE